LDVLVDPLIFSADCDSHRVPLQPYPVDHRFLRVVQLRMPVAFLPEKQFGPADQNCKVDHPVQRQFLRLPRPLFSRISPDFCGNIQFSAVIPLRKSQRKPLRIRLIGGAPIDISIILRNDYRLVF